MVGLIRLILHPDQAESLRGCGGASQSSIFRPKHLAGPGFRPAAAANFDESPNNRADHVVKKSVGLDFNCEEITVIRITRLTRPQFQVVAFVANP